jgi:hypothetical protein
MDVLKPDPTLVGIPDPPTLVGMPDLAAGGLKPSIRKKLYQ